MFIPAKIGGCGQMLIAYCVEKVPLLGVDKGVTEQDPKELLSQQANPTVAKETTNKLQEILHR